MYLKQSQWLYNDKFPAKHRKLFNLRIQGKETQLISKW